MIGGGRRNRSHARSGAQQPYRRFISAQYTDPSEADVEGQVRQAMSNDGFLITSVADIVNEATAGATVSPAPSSPSASASATASASANN